MCPGRHFVSRALRTPRSALLLPLVPRANFLALPTKPGKELSTDGPRAAPPRAAPIPSHRAHGRVVDSADRDLPLLRRLRRLLDLGGAPPDSLRLRIVSVAVLFAGTFRGFAARVVRPEARLVAVPPTVLTRVPHSLGTGRLSLHLLLLSRHLLQVVLARPTELRRE